MASAQVLGTARTKEDIYNLIQRFIDEVCTVEQLIMQLDLMAEDIWRKYKTDDQLHLKIQQAAGLDKSRRLTLFFMGLGWLDKRHLTQGDIHRNLGVMLEEKHGSVAIMRGFEMVSVNIIWLGLCMVLVGTQKQAQNLDTTSIKNRQFFMLVESKLHRKEVVTMVESINIDKIQKFLTQVETTLENIKSFLVFSPNHKSCFSQANSFLDEIS